MDCGKAQSGVRKVKKKQVKDELDRIKQAEKKKRRLEKALATSAAIISELEKKKQKKKEEQQRLDEEGAAIAEAVALQVLIGEDSDESCSEVMMEKNEEFNPWECYASNFDLFVGGGSARTTAAVIPHPHHQQLSRSPNEEIGWVSNAHGGSRCQWNGYGWIDGGSFVSEIQTPYFVEGSWEATEISAAGLIAAQAVSSLQISDDDDDVDAFVFNRMLRG